MTFFSSWVIGLGVARPSAIAALDMSVLPEWLLPKGAAMPLIEAKSGSIRRTGLRRQSSIGNLALKALLLCDSPGARIFARPSAA
jgi:hypothetical protein